MKRSIPSIRYVFGEGRGEGGPTVTIHLPQKLAEDLLHVLHEAMEVAGIEEPGEDEVEDDELEGELEDDFDDGEPGVDDMFGGEDDDDRRAGDEDEEDEDIEEEGAHELGSSLPGGNMDDEELDEKHIGFNKLAGELSHKKGVHNPKALAAFIGRKKYGAAGMARKSAAGRRKH